MKIKFSELVLSAKNAAENASKNISSAIEHEDGQAAIAWVKNAALKTANEASKLGKVAAQSDMAKDAAAGAAVGAVIAIPVPIIGPIGGAVVGASLGIYKNITKSKTTTNESASSLTNEKTIDTTDVYDQLVKFDDLRKQGIITDDEFEQKKKALLA